MKINVQITSLGVSILVLGMVLAPACFAADENKALDQLKNATTGSQSTGVTFDGGKGPTDAYPKGNVSTGTVTGVPVDVQTSTGTAKSK